MQVRNSTWEVSIASSAVVAKRIKEDLLGTNAAQAQQESLSAEVIRVSLWSQSAYRQASSLTEASVTTQRLLKIARAIWRPIATTYRGNVGMSSVQDESLSGEPLELEREILENLADLGDIFELGGGRWIPAPLRFVRSTPQRHLLVGGMPTRLLAPVLRRALSLHGTFRYIEGNVDTSLLQDAHIPVQWQSRESWLGPVQRLEELADYFDEMELLPVSHQHVSESSLEAYDTSKFKPQYLRWESPNRVRDGRYLLRASTPWGTHHFTIGSLNEHRLIHQSAEVRQADIRRLCYALDQRAGKPTKARWNQKRSLLILHSELPGRERKLLSSIATLIENSNGNYYPRQWIIARDVEGVFSMLNELGIQVEAEN